MSVYILFCGSLLHAKQNAASSFKCDINIKSKKLTCRDLNLTEYNWCYFQKVLWRFFFKVIDLSIASAMAIYYSNFMILISLGNGLEDGGFEKNP